MQHKIGLALVVLQAALLGLLSQSFQFPLIVVAVAAIGVFTHLRITLSREQAFFLSAIAAIFFLLKHRFAPHDFPRGAEFIRTQVAFIIAQFLLSIEAAQFVIRHKQDRLSPVLPALGAVALICIADVQITEEQRVVTRLFAVGYPLLWALYLWSCRQPLPLPPSGDEARQSARISAAKRRRFVAGLLMMTIAGTTWYSSKALYRFEKRIEGWLVRMMSRHGPPSTTGFSRSSHLGSVAHRKSRREDEIVLTVDSDTSPDYLRGAVFTNLDHSEWQAPSISRGGQLMPSDDRPPGMKSPARKEHLFTHPETTDEPGVNWRYLEFWIADNQRSAAFAPLGTRHILTPGDRVGALPFGLFLLYDIEESTPYTACVSERGSQFAIGEEDRALLLAVPQELRPAVDELAAEIFADAETTQEKIAAVENYFQRNYQYQLGIEIPAGENPLLYFLREKPPAHCEYFASAATLLLRTAGVPCYYATGFVAAERNPSGGYWIARNRDAHAWVEAYDEETGTWATVEATPAGGVPGADGRTTSFAWWHAFLSDWKKLRVFLAQGRMDRVLGLFRSPRLMIPAGLFVALMIGYLAWRFPWKFHSRKSTHKEVDPNHREMQKLLETVDQRLDALGFKRGVGETLHQFANRLIESSKSESAANGSKTKSDPVRIREAAEWYLAYAGSVYRGQWDTQSRQELRTQMPAG